MGDPHTCQPPPLDPAVYQAARRQLYDYSAFHMETPHGEVTSTLIMQVEGDIWVASAW